MAEAVPTLRDRVYAGKREDAKQSQPEITHE
jgi:hypothetical protein